jgi:hypothetical protein
MAQEQELDKIVKLDGSVTEGKILRVSATGIEFDPDGEIPFMIIPRSEVMSIVYASGEVVIITEVSPKVEGMEDAKTKLEGSPSMPSGVDHSVIQTNIEIDLNTGISFPLSPDEFADYWEKGINLGLTFSRSSPWGGWFVSVVYSKFRFEKYKFLSDLGLDPSEVWIGGLDYANSVISAGTRWRIWNTKPFYLYLQGGSALLFETINKGSISYYDSLLNYYQEEIPSESDASFSLLIGLGLHFKIIRFLGFFCDANIVVSTEREGTVFSPVRFGLRFAF